MGCNRITATKFHTGLNRQTEWNVLRDGCIGGNRLLQRYTVVMLKSDIDERGYINFLRGLAIFLMLWGHSIQFASVGQIDYFENVVFKVIYSFHMPLFMMISGYLFYYSAEKRDFLELFEYKGKSLMYSILMGSVLNLLLSQGLLRGWHSYTGAISICEIWFLWRRTN